MIVPNASRLAALLALVSGLVAAPALAQDSARQAAAPAAEEATRGGGSPADRMWWNQDNVAQALGLGAELRAELDALLLGHIEIRKQRVEKMREARNAFVEALKAGDLAGAREVTEATGTQSAELSRSQNELVLAVFERLSADQRRALAEQFPEIIERPWIRGANRGARRRGPGNRGPADRGPGANDR